MEDQTETNLDLKHYEVWPGKTQFYRKGSFMTGPNPRNLIIVVTLINVTNFLSMCFSWVVSKKVNLTFVQDYANDKLDFGPLIIGLMLWVGTDLALWKTAIGDPGLLPRMNKDPHAGGHLQYAFKNKNHLILSGVRGQKTTLIKLKICDTCK